MADIRLTFKGADYVIPDDRAFELGERLEDIVTLGQMAKLFADPKFYTIARCFGTMLRYAGCKVSDREVLTEMMDRLKAGGPGAGRSTAIEALAQISAVLMDGAPTDGAESEAPEKTEAS
ncbi:MAG: hypothetical protein V4720_06200 [Pseudomonadota bacterium]